MKITLLAGKEGVLMTKPTEAFSFCEDLKNSESITRFGKIIADNNGFAVKFCEPALGVYDKQGFKTREDAIAYEQDILDKHLAEYMTVKN